MSAVEMFAQIIAAVAASMDCSRLGSIEGLAVVARDSVGEKSVTVRCAGTGWMFGSPDHSLKDIVE